MTSPVPDQYQRAMALLDDEGFWDRYLDQLDDDRRGLDLDSAAQSADPGTLDDHKNVTVLAPVRSTEPHAVAPGTRRRSTNTTMLQRAAIAAAAAIAIIGGITVLTNESDTEPVDVFTEPNPTPTVAVPTPSPVLDPTPTVVPTPVPTEAPEPSPAPQPPAPVSTPIPEAVVTVEPTAAAIPAQDDDTEGAESTDEAEPAGDPGADPNAAPAYVVRAESGLGRVLVEINDARTSEGLPTLRFSPALAAVAHDQAWTLTDYQDAYLSRQPGFTLDPALSAQSDVLRENAWFEATIVGGINIADALPQGWTGVQQHLDQGPILDVVRGDAAGALHVGEFTHVGVAYAAGIYADTTVIVYANYPNTPPAEPLIVVRTDRQCLEGLASAGHSDRIVVDSSTSITSTAWDIPMDRVQVRLCPGTMSGRPPLPQFNSRYRVSLVRQSDRSVLGEFTCFIWNSCEGLVDLQGSSGAFNIVLTKLGPESGELRFAQVQAAFIGTDRAVSMFVAGNGSRLIDSLEAEALSERLALTLGGWSLESPSN